MTEKEIKYYFNKVGYKGRSITQIWYVNSKEIRGKLDKYIPTLGQKIEKIIRWYTDDGIKALGEVRGFIKTKVDEKSVSLNEELETGIFKNPFTVIDFNELRIEGKSINDYMYSKLEHSYSYLNWNDLSGIDLRNLALHNVIIKNAQLSHAIFDNSNFYNIQFQNCNLSDCSFKNCHASSLRIIGDRGAFTDCNWVGSLVNNINISSRNIGVSPTYKKINYFQLLYVSLTGRVNRHSNFTDFSACTITDDNTNYQFKKHIDYINWYQSTLLKYGKIKTAQNIFKKNVRRSQNFISAFTSMNWYSPFSTLVTGGLIILVFTLIYNFIASEYFSGLDGFGNSLNYSIQIFTNLGYGDIKPDFTHGLLGGYLTSIESALGYFWLALTIMVFSKRIYR